MDTITKPKREACSWSKTIGRICAYHHPSCQPTRCEDFFNLLLEINDEARRFQAVHIGLQAPAAQRQAAGAAPLGDAVPAIGAAPLADAPAAAGAAPAVGTPDSQPFMPFRIVLSSETGDEYTYLTDEAFNTANLPPRLRSIRIDNFSFYNHPSKTPLQYQFEIVLDFHTPPAFDFGSNPSNPTVNESHISVYGLSEVWVNGSIRTISRVLTERKRWVTFLFHKPYVYDVLLWLVTFPFLYRTLAGIDLAVRVKWASSSGAILGLAYLFSVFYSFMLLKIGFNFARWLFPYTELRERPRLLQGVQRKFYWFLFVTFFAGLISNFGVAAVKWYFGLP